MLESFFLVRNAVICPKWQFSKPTSSGNTSQVENSGAVPCELNLKHGQCLWPTQENAEAFGGASSLFTSQFSHSFSRTSTISLWKKYFVAYYSSETEKVRPVFLAVCMEHCSKQSHFPVWKFLFFVQNSSSNVIKVLDAIVSMCFVSWVRTYCSLKLFHYSVKVQVIWLVNYQFKALWC